MNLSNFAERLSELIDEKEKNAKIVGEEIGCGNATISHYLNGSHLPTVEMTIKLADYFNCSTDFLLGLTEFNNTQNFKPCPPFSERFQTVCKERGISRYAIRKNSGIAESSLRYWAQGKMMPSINNVVKIAEALGVTVDYLLGREN